jgi:hypothetical protein
MGGGLGIVVPILQPWRRLGYAVGNQDEEAGIEDLLDIMQTTRSVRRLTRSGAG